MPGFRRILLTLADYYQNHHEEVEEQAAQLGDYLKQRSSAPLRGKGGVLPEGTMPLEMLSNASRELAAEFDPVNGGFGNAPNFPNTMSLQLLLPTPPHPPPRALRPHATRPQPSPL